MRDLAAIDQQLRLVAAIRATAAEHGGRPSIDRADQLLDERLQLTKPSPTVSGDCGGRIVVRR